MSRKKTQPEVNKDEIIAEIRRKQEESAKTYREQALKIFPWICGRCGREFTGKRLRELTVHHKDSDHNNNPPDGSNWELLCLYCHDNEHSWYEDVEWYGDTATGDDQEPLSGNKPFSGLEALLKKDKK